ncbi:MAG: two-component SAPR family response regulator [Cyclobacteriaceae bacterium]
MILGHCECCSSNRKAKPDLIFRDINISGLDEPELVNVLSHRPKVIIISSHPEWIMEADYPGMKYDGYIQKNR